MKKTILILFLAICVLFTLSGVCAGDVSDTAIASDNTDQIIEETNDLEVVSSEDEEVIASSQGEDVLGATAGTFTELQNKIDNAASGSTITLDKDYNYDEGFKKTGISISKSLTINGNGHSLNGLSKSRIFNIFSGEITFKNIKFINGRAIYGVNGPDGGAIKQDFEVGGTVVFSGCSFTNNVADDDGGAVAFRRGTFTNCIFTNNKANGEKGNGYGGAILQENMVGYVDPVINIKNCIFTNNIAKKGGGAIRAVDAETTITGCTFNSNKATEGGAIYSRQPLTIISSKFNANHAYGDGGAIYYDGGDCEIRSSTFTKNVADKTGGAIFNLVEIKDGKTYAAKIVKCTFTDNKAKSDKDICGGNIQNCVFKTSKTKLTLKKVKVRKSAKKLVLKATLKKGKTPLKGKKITFKFKGKKYKAKTNKKGIAKVTIKKKVLKKLKVGKKVKYQASYGKLTVKRTVKVKK